MSLVDESGKNYPVVEEVEPDFMRLTFNFLVQNIHIVHVTNLESFRALTLSRLRSFRTLKCLNQIEMMKLPIYENFGGLKLSILVNISAEHFCVI